jgi:hypothetical protein
MSSKISCKLQDFEFFFVFVNNLKVSTPTHKKKVITSCFCSFNKQKVPSKKGNNYPGGSKSPILPLNGGTYFNQKKETQ